MRRLFAALALAALASMGLVAPAHATGTPTLGTYDTTFNHGSSTVQVFYTVSPNSLGTEIQVNKVIKTGSATSRLRVLVNNTSALGNGHNGNVATSVPSGTVTYENGVNGVSWSSTAIGNGGAELWSVMYGLSPANATHYDLSGNVAPPPPTDISGSFSMDFNCTSSVNTAYSSHWTAYYTVAGASPSWTATFTSLVRNSETGTPLSVDLKFKTNYHIVTSDVVNFTWADGDPIPAIQNEVNWGSGINCTSLKDFVANF